MKNVLISATLSATPGLSAFSSLAQDVDLRMSRGGATAAIRSPSRRWRNSTNNIPTSTSKQNTPAGTAIFHA
ncbi:hypothetical protein F7P09_24635 [Klebsiella pneumoniae]|nr:hypothetical protein F7P09_24635 [Klebsiella pneumoniae]